MEFFKRLFRGETTPALPLEAVEKLISPLAVPAIQLVPSGSQTPCYFGGVPQLPVGVAWPEREGRPLTFLASIDLPSIAAVVTLDWLPRSGRLLFFYDIEGQPWGFDPKDRGGSRVLHADDGGGSPTSTSNVLPRRFMSPRRIASYPSYERPEMSALNLTDAQSDAAIEISDAAYGATPYHQIGGYPHAVQADAMELECQLASAGLYVGDPSGYEDVRAKALESGATDWRLLLQMDSDDDLGVMWGDAGIIYFWIREDDARAGRFDQAWLILQCH